CQMLIVAPLEPTFAHQLLEQAGITALDAFLAIAREGDVPRLCEFEYLPRHQLRCFLGAGFAEDPYLNQFVFHIRTPHPRRRAMLPLVQARSSRTAAPGSACAARPQN